MTLDYKYSSFGSLNHKTLPQKDMEEKNLNFAWLFFFFDDFLFIH